MNAYIKKFEKPILLSMLCILFSCLSIAANPGKKVVKLGFIPLTDCAPHRRHTDLTTTLDGPRRLTRSQSGKTTPHD